MAEFMPHFAPVVALLFLGTVLLIGASLLVLFYAAVRRFSFFAKLGAGAALRIAAGYFILLSGVSFASSEPVLPAGGWKIFAKSIATFYFAARRARSIANAFFRTRVAVSVS